jgi:broad specificity phosphatase PhoE
MGQIFLVRHGQASFASDDYDRLSDLGVAQCRLLGEWFARCNQRFTRAFSGSLRRHRETADACLAVLPDPLRPPGPAVVDPGFDEYDSSDVMVRHRPDLADAAGIRRFVAGSDDPRRAFQAVFAQAVERWASGEHDAEYRESWPAFRARSVAALQRAVESAGASQDVLVFSSGGPIAAICQHVMGLPDRRAFELSWSLVNSSVTRLLYRPGRISLHALNAYPHLESASRAGCVTYR